MPHPADKLKYLTNTINQFRREVHLGSIQIAHAGAPKELAEELKNIADTIQSTIDHLEIIEKRLRKVGVEYK